MFDIIIISLLNSLLFAGYCYFVSHSILEKKSTGIKSVLMALIPFLLMYYCVLCLLESNYTIFFSGLCAFFFIKIIFRESIYISLFISIIIHTFRIGSKILILTIINDNSMLLINTYKTLDWSVLYVDTLALIISTICILILKRQLIRLIKFVSGLKRKKLLILLTIYIHFILIYLYQPPHSCCPLQTVTDMLVMFTITGIVIFNISSEMKMEILNKHYQEMFEYSKANAELLTKYKLQVHENKNKLLMINGLLDGPKKNVRNYVNSILQEMKDNQNITNYWLSELKYIPLPGVRNFINYKLTQLKELGAEIEIFVSSELEHVDAFSFGEREYNDLSTILGVILDNMIESIKETDEKLVSLNIRLENNTVNFDFVNSFSGNVEINRINEIGYTTKGEEHGVGLSLLSKIIKNSNRFECIPEIMDNFFIQHLIIKLPNKRNYKKTQKKNKL